MTGFDRFSGPVDPVAEASSMIAARCVELGIPDEFQIAIRAIGSRQ
jgi:hypothetical protein